MRFIIRFRLEKQAFDVEPGVIQVLVGAISTSLSSGSGMEVVTAPSPPSTGDGFSDEEMDAGIVNGARKRKELSPTPPNSGGDEGTLGRLLEDIRVKAGGVQHEANLVLASGGSSSLEEAIEQLVSSVWVTMRWRDERSTSVVKKLRKPEVDVVGHPESKGVESRDASTETPCWWPYSDASSVSAGMATPGRPEQSTASSAAYPVEATGAAAKPGRKRGKLNKDSIGLRPAEAARVPPSGQEPGEEQFTLVRRKGRKIDAASSQHGAGDFVTQNPPAAARVDRRVLRKPAAVLVKVGGGLSYADTLKKVRESEVDFEGLGTRVTSMRKTTSGDLIVELTKSNKSMAAVDVLRDKIVSVIPGSSVKCLRQTAEVEIVDLDEITTKDEVQAAILRSINAEDAMVSVTGIWKTRSGQQMATATVPIAALGKLTHICIGWLRCRVRPRREQPQRCYRCHGFGHGSRQCSGPDLSGTCRRCGLSGHLEKTCSAGDDKCVACDRMGHNGATHRPGSGACAAWREAFKAIAKKQQ